MILRLLLTSALFFAVTFANAATVINGKGSTFVMTYNITYSEPMREVTNKAALFWADTLRSEVPIEVYMDTQSLSCVRSYTTHVNTMTPAAAINFPNAPQANTFYPMALANAYAGVDLDPNKVDITIRFNYKMSMFSFCPSWYLGDDMNFSNDEYSLYYETLQEIGHGLGLIPLGALNSGKTLNGSPDVYWNQLQSYKLGLSFSELTETQIANAAHSSEDLAFTGNNTLIASEHLEVGRTENSVLMFSRSYTAASLTGLHLHEATQPKQLMMVDLRGDVPELDLAVAMLEDIGWESTRNAAPVITGQQPLQVNEDQSLTLFLANITAEDETPENLSLTILPGGNYTFDGLVITPDEHFNGQLSVSVSVSDGEKSSAPYSLTVNVLAVNDAPVITGQQALDLNEDTSITLMDSLFTISDADQDALQLTFLDGDNYTAIANVIQPAANFHGILTVPMQAFDGVDHSEVFNVTIDVFAVNDAPIITGQQLLMTEEDTSLLITTAALNISDVDSTDFYLTVNPGENYTATNNLILPNANFSGTLTVPVMVSDGSLNSNTFELTISVVPTNDVPVLVSQHTMQTLEDTAFTITSAMFEISDEDSTEFFTIIAAGDHYSVDGTTITPEQNFSGELTVPVKVSDGLAHSNELFTTISVIAVNDAPVLSNVTAQQIFEDSSYFLTLNDLTFTDPDSDEFSIIFAQGENYQIAENEIIPDSNWFGELNINIAVSDGEHSSNIQVLTLAVQPVNDLPELTETSLNQAQIYRDFSQQLNATDLENDSLTYSLRNAPVWLEISESGLLTGYPIYADTGEHTFSILVTDGGNSVGFERTLTVLDDASATDIQTNIEMSRTIWSTQGWAPAVITVLNNGPRTLTDVNVELDFSGTWATTDTRCSTELNSCTLSVEQNETIDIQLQNTNAGSIDFNVQSRHTGFEIAPENNANQITLTFTDGEPTSPQFTIPGFGQGTTRAIGIADIQGGRWPEIMFANGPTEASTAYRFEQSIFTPVLHSHLADASNSYAMTLADLNNDGHKDWVLANGGTEGNTVYLNDGEGQFTLVDQLGNADSRSVASGDIDGDGDKDLVFANADSANALYLNNGNGEFEFFMELGSWSSRKVIIHDFNGDGRADILFANRGFRNKLLFNRGLRNSQTNARMQTRTATTSRVTQTDQATGFALDPISLGDENQLTTDMIVADLDGDGIATDIVFVNEADETQPNTLQVFAIGGNEQLVQTSLIETGSVQELDVGDYDGDGKDDLALLRPGGALEMVQPNGNNLTVIDVVDTQGADTILLVDVDGSGRADVISANADEQNSRLDFSGDVTDDETRAIEPPSDDLLPMNTAAVRHGGSGLPILAMALILVFRKRK